jgi:hypothetical protein
VLNFAPRTDVKPHIYPIQSPNIFENIHDIDYTCQLIFCLSCVFGRPLGGSWEAGLELNIFTNNRNLNQRAELQILTCSVHRNLGEGSGDDMMWGLGLGVQARCAGLRYLGLV